MSFDPRSLERLQELGRQLPKPRRSLSGNTGLRSKKTRKNFFAN